MTTKPLHIISLGGGVQSSFMAIWAALGKITPMPAAAIFADTQDEPRAVYDYLDYLKSELPFPLIRTSKGSLSEAALRVRTSAKTGLTYLKPSLPVFMRRANGDDGMMARQCTNDYKIEMVRREIRKLIGRKRSAQAVVWIGISTDEADRQKPSKVLWLENRHPLLEVNYSRGQCLSWLAGHHYRRPPKSACKYCPYHDDDFWLDLKKHSPSEFAEAVTFEKQYQISMARCSRLDGVPYLHDSRQPLDTVEFTRGSKSHFGNECEGMCGV